MADITINELPDLIISGTNNLVHTNGTTTGKATVNQLRTALNIINPVNADWNATSGLAQILNKPNQTGLLDIKIYTSGSGTYITPAGTKSLYVIAQGGGGGSSGGRGTSYSCVNGGNGVFGGMTGLGGGCGSQCGGGGGTGGAGGASGGNVANITGGSIFGLGVGSPGGVCGYRSCSGGGRSFGCTDVTSGFGPGGNGGSAISYIVSPASSYNYSIGNRAVVAVWAYA